MTRAEMERLGALLWGYGWKSSLADARECINGIIESNELRAAGL